MIGKSNILFSEMLDLGTYVTLMGKPKFVLLADEIQNRLVSSKNVAEYVLK